MKRYVFLLYLGLLGFGCAKEHTDSNNTPSVIGQWQWYKTMSWVMTSTPQSTGKTMSLMFNSDSTCTRTGDLTPPSTGSYSITNLPNYPEYNFKILLSADTTYYHEKLI